MEAPAATPSPVALVDVLDLAQKLTSGEKYELVMSLMTSFKATFGIPVKGQKAKKVKDPNAPKKEVKDDSYIYFVNHCIWPVLQKYADTLEQGEEKKLIRGVSARTQVAKSFWETMKDKPSDERKELMSAITEDQILGAYRTWKDAPRDPAAESERKASKKPKLKDMTDEQRKAFYEARGAAAAAARAAKKAAKSIEPAESEPAESEADAEVEEVKPYVWEHDIGNGLKKYERIDTDGMSYLYDLTTKKYLGAYMEKTNKLNAKIPDPSA